MIVATKRDAVGVLEPLFAGAAAERLAILHLDGDRRMLALDERPVEEGESALLPVRAILEAALRNGSEGLLIARNRPGSDPQPARADIEATRRLAEAAAGLGIALHDHLIFAGSDCRSFRELGLL